MSDIKLLNSNLEEAVQESYAAYTAANPQSRQRFEQAARFMPGGNTRTVLFYNPFPLCFARGQGCRLEDVDGHGYVDFLGEYTAGLYGHSNPVIQAAVTRALNDEIVMGGQTELEGRLAAAVCARFPSVELIRFTNSGTEANLMAVGAARAVTGRPAILAFKGGYHGGALSFRYVASADPAAAVSPMNAPYPAVLAAYNDIEGTARLIDEHAARLAAVIVEPMLGGSGCIPATREFLAALRERCDRHGIALIFDEVMTSRLSPGGLQQAHGVLPDMTTFGKYLGGGLPTGAFGGRVKWMERFDPRRPDALQHAGTFNNNVLTMAAGLAGLTRIFTPQAAVALNEAGERLRARLNAAVEDRGLPLRVTGCGSMMTIHPGVRGEVRSPADIASVKLKQRDLLQLDLIARGVYIANRGMINLSLPMTEAEFEILVGAFAEYLDTRAPVIG